MEHKIQPLHVQGNCFSTCPSYSIIALKEGSADYVQMTGIYSRNYKQLLKYLWMGKKNMGNVQPIMTDKGH